MNIGIVTHLTPAIAWIALLAAQPAGIGGIEFTGPGPDCANGEIESFEQCDDGNRSDGDACRANCVLPLGAPGDFLSDDFSGCPADPGWTVFDRHGLGTLSRESGAAFDARLVLAIPGSATYDAWPGGNQPRNGAFGIARPVFGDDGALEIEVRFASVPTGSIHDQGILVEGGSPGCSTDATPCDWLRFDTFHDGSMLRAFGGRTIGGANSTGFLATIPQAAGQFLRVTQSGDSWSMWVSPDGTAWSAAGSFTQPLAVGAVGLFMANVSASAFTSEVDYFFNVADPISPEDGSGFACDDAHLCTDDRCAYDAGGDVWACSNEDNQTSGCACGDGVADPDGNEACDDGDTAAGDGCAADCTVETGWSCSGSPSTCAPVCGDGRLVGGEACDDGGHAAGDGCSPACDVEPGWSCAGEPSACSTTCGDGIVAGSEQCDDGNVAGGDGCSPTCSIEIEIGCGNTNIDDGEECDDGDGVAGNGCEPDCTATDYVMNGGFAGLSGWQSFFTSNAGHLLANGGRAEVVIDSVPPSPNFQVFQVLPRLLGGTWYRLSFDAHSSNGRNLQVKLLRDNTPFTHYGLAEYADLTLQSQTFRYAFLTPPAPELPEPRLSFFFNQAIAGTRYFIDNVRIEQVDARCGNGSIEVGEQCDHGQGNSVHGGCLPDCKLATDCGNGVLDAGEQCDDAGPSAACDADCTWSACGDGTLNVLAGESCEDGDSADGNQCTSSCGANPNAVLNGGFELGSAFWGFYSNGTGQWAIERLPGGRAGVVAKLFTQGTNVQLFQSGVLLEGSTDYRLSFVARSQNGENARVQIFRNRPGFENYGVNEVLDLTPSDRAFTIDFTTTPGDKNDARLSFKLLGGVAPTEFRFRDVRLVRRTTTAWCGNGVIDAGEACDDGDLVARNGCENDCTVTNFVTNGDFEAGHAGWASLFSGAAGSVSAAEGSATVAIVPQGPGQNAQFYQVLPKLWGGERYRLSFAARSSNGADLSVRMMKDNAPFLWYGLDRRVDLTPELQSFSFVFDARAGDELPEPRLIFDFLDAPETTFFRIDDVVLERVSARCGDGVLDHGEPCDGGAAGSPACRADCTLLTACGNGTLDAGEACDDAGASPTCNADCTPAVCGDGIVNLSAGERCDDGDLIEVNLCDRECQPSASSIVNGDFSLGTYHWIVYTNATATFAPGTGADAGSGVLRVLAPGTAAQILQSGVLLEGDRDYRLTFFARSSGGEDLRVQTFKNRPPYTNFGLDSVIDVTAGEQFYTLDFRTTPDDKNDARLVFRLLQQSASTEVRIRDVKLEPR